MSSEGDGFAPYFVGRRINAETDQALLRGSFELRYAVYCLECKYLSAEAYAEPAETDEQDALSAHFCSINHSGELIGCVRLVGQDVDGKFPFQYHCPSLNPGIELPDPAESGEVSRLIVRRDYRRRRGDTLAGVTVASETPAEGERRASSPQILLSMYRQMYQHSLQNGVRYWYTAMEPSLARSLHFFGFSFKQIGPPAEYYGTVAPYMADLRELEKDLAASSPELLEWMRTPESVVN